MSSSGNRIRGTSIYDSPLPGLAVPSTPISSPTIAIVKEMDELLRVSQEKDIFSPHRLTKSSTSSRSRERSSPRRRSRSRDGSRSRDRSRSKDHYNSRSKSRERSKSLRDLGDHRRRSNNSKVHFESSGDEVFHYSPEEHSSRFYKDFSDLKFSRRDNNINDKTLHLEELLSPQNLDKRTYLRDTDSRYSQIFNLPIHSPSNSLNLDSSAGTLSPLCGFQEQCNLMKKRIKRLIELNNSVALGNIGNEKDTTDK